MKDENETLDLDTNDQENEVQDDENNTNGDGEASEGTEAEGSEAEGSEDSESESEGEIGKEVDQKKANQRSASHRISNRIRKLKGDLTQSESGNQRLENDLAIANQRIEILQLANNQNGGNRKPVEPSPDDFEDGVQDPKYLKKVREFDRASIREEMRVEISKQSKTVQDHTANDSVQRGVERKQRDHYRRAIKGNNDYEDKEDVVKDILGTAAIKDIIQNFDDSDKIIYRLGSDEDLALEVADAMENKDHVKAVRLLERASNGLKPKPKTKKTTPDPDTEIEGGSPGSSKKKRGPKGATFT